ncbi:MAG: aminotransferase class V-fold PLP-dependent enzyme [Chloroflexi bacterium]|nr:aminotransferase class V-fold PLP-dependent enzyme [Chloroflexota bacterium]
MEAAQAMGFYEQLGVKRIINARGTVTRIGGSLMPPEVLQAMNEAAQAFVNLDELNRKAGEVVARCTGAEAGMVCAGAASGMVLQVAACVAGADPARVRRLPDTTGMKNEIVIQKCHRNPYDHAWRMAGVRMVEIGLARTVFPWELEQAINEHTAAVAYTVAPWLGHEALPLPQVVEIAHKKGVPVIVDASATLPPAENLTRFVKMGCDMVTFSGGKGIMGPQSSGILCGRKDLIDAARMHASPNHAIGRPMKVGKEEIAGLVTALQMYVNRDHAADMRRWTCLAQTIADGVSDIPGLLASVECDDRDRFAPQAVIRFTSAWRGPSPAQVADTLLAEDPPIYVGTDAGRDEVYLNSHMLQEGEAEIVARRLRAALT